MGVNGEDNRQKGRARMNGYWRKRERRKGEDEKRKREMGGEGKETVRGEVERDGRKGWEGKGETC